MKNTRVGFSVHAIVAIVLIFAVCGTAEEVFTKIAQQDNITYNGFPSLAINSGGNVLFQASMPGGQSGYFTGKGGAHQEILTTGDGFSDLSYATINDGDMVAFSAQKNGEFGMSVPGIFSTTGGSVNDLAIRNPSDPCGFDVLYGWPHINSDTVAFPARLNTSRYAIITVPAIGGAPTVVVGNSSEWGSFGSPAINSNGLVACWGYHNTEGAKIITTSGSTITTIADTSGSCTGFASEVSVNRHGQVAYVAYVTINETSYMGLYLSDGTTTQTIAETTPAGGAYTNIQFPCVNDSGVVSFFGRLPDNREGIFTGPDPATSTVVVEGGLIHDRTIYNVMYNLHAMNNVGQIAFVAQFNDNYYYNIYRYDPTGSTQENPVIGTYVDGGPENRFFDFPVVPTDTWVDPPIASGYTYTMTNSSLFTSISDFPTGFDGLFTVSVDSVELGDQFMPGDKLIFADYPTELGALLQSDIGVTNFTVTGIKPLVNSTDPVAFPLRITFDTDFADITMTPILAECDNDGDIDLADMVILASFWLNQNCDVIDCNGADIDQDNDVDLVDFAILAANWN